MRIKPRNLKPIIAVCNGYYYITEYGELVGLFDTEEEAIEELRKYLTSHEYVL